MPRTHEQFLGELAASSSAVTRVASWLVEKQGIPVVLQPTFQAQTFDKRADYADDGDLGVLMRVEVKRRDLSFTGTNDYPYPTAIVDACPNFDKKHPKPWLYILLNSEMSAALVVNVGVTQKYWVKQELFDGRNHVKQPFYVCDKKMLGAIKL